MAAGTLYTYPENFRAYKALIAAQYSGAKVTIAPDFKFGETNKTDAFLKKFPLGKVPAFEADDGTWLFESNAIAYYVASDQLVGSSRTDGALIQQWVNFADQEILPASCSWVFPTMGIMQYNKQNTERAKEDVKVALALLNSHLETRTYLVGERITLADVCTACNLFLLYQHVLEPAFIEPYVNANRWFTTLVNQPQFKAVIGDFTFCTKMAQFDAKKYAELQGAAGKAGKGGKKEGQKQQPKQDKPKKEAKAEEPEEEAPKKPSKDPFAHLPQGNFVMDEWKKTYQNEKDTVGVALPYFWEKFEADKLSLWYCEYKYPDELALIFMSANLVSGMMQRLDRMRKHAFGVMNLFGKDHASTISGVWVWRGQDLAFELSPDLQVDYESYEWKKLDPTSEETKLLVKEYFDGNGAFGGKTLNQAKVFL